MLIKQQILFTIKQQIREILPDADVILFGSRLNNTDTEESDWDILVLTDDKTPTKQIRQVIHDKIFPLSVSVGSFINLLLVTKSDWQNNPSYYSLKKSIALNSLLL
jgi:uncharacterized protein